MTRHYRSTDRDGNIVEASTMGGLGKLLGITKSAVCNRLERGTATCEIEFSGGAEQKKYEAKGTQDWKWTEPEKTRFYEEWDAVTYRLFRLVGSPAWRYRARRSW